jgi:hypothetical protein
VLGSEPTPEFSAAVSENCNQLLDAFSDPSLREIAILKLEGCSYDELARRFDCVPRTIERKLNLIRVKWSSLGAWRLSVVGACGR